MSMFIIWSGNNFYVLQYDTAVFYNYMVQNRVLSCGDISDSLIRTDLKWIIIVIVYPVIKVQCLTFHRQLTLGNYKQKRDSKIV